MPLTPAAPILNPRLIAHFSRRFNCDLIIQNTFEVDDGQGGKTRSWTPGFEVLGAIHALTGAERLAEGGLGVTNTHQILIAWIDPFITAWLLDSGIQLDDGVHAFTPGIDPSCRVLYRNRIFDVHNLTDYGEQHLLLELMCEERYRHL